MVWFSPCHSAIEGQSGEPGIGLQYRGEVPAASGLRKERKAPNARMENMLRIKSLWQRWDAMLELTYLNVQEAPCCMNMRMEVCLRLSGLRK